jgi:hypothetical protein
LQQHPLCRDIHFSLTSIQLNCAAALVTPKIAALGIKNKQVYFVLLSLIATLAVAEDSYARDKK